MKVMGTTSISDTTIKAMAVADNCTCGWELEQKQQPEIIIFIMDGYT